MPHVHVIDRDVYHCKSSTSEVVSPEKQRATFRYFIFVASVVIYYGACSNNKIRNSGGRLFQVLQVVIQENAKYKERHKLNRVSKVAFADTT